ncbi:hypothetical protein ACJWDR_29130 [Streptomyces tauricus]|uniref:hypothetical protein n=1 Tax=Streptomyces tauricus TaxID=68274 RepID=UPI00387F26BC
MTTRTRLLDRVARANARADTAVAELEAGAETAKATLHALQQVAGELSRAKDVIAQVVAAAGHPDSAVQDVRQFADALVEQLAAAHVDIRLELSRTEGARL